MVDVKTALRRIGLARASDLQAALGVSQGTVSRSLAALGDRVVRIGRARAARYALAEPVGQHGFQWPLFAIDVQGRANLAGQLASLAGDRTYLASADQGPVLREGGEAPGVFPGLPWFLADLRPQGFLGRVFGHAHAARLGAPPDITLWSDRHVIAALLTEGDDLAGDLVLGEAMLERIQQRRLVESGAVDVHHRARRYPALASMVLAGEPIGSSAGGEQPKFTTCVRGEDGAYRHVLVKFTDSGDTPARTRWVDLLLAEHHAAEALRAHGVDAARSEIVRGGDRVFLEVTRFDRHGAHGRSGYVTLAALDDSLYGLRDDWRRASARLARDRWISADDARIAAVLHWFGAQIGNSDMHFGNLSFLRGAERPLGLAPAYDMLPMQYRPAATGELVPRAYLPPMPPPTDLVPWQAASVAAADFWTRVANDERVSDGFREIARSNGAMLARARAQLAPDAGAPS